MGNSHSSAVIHCYYFHYSTLTRSRRFESNCKMRQESVGWCLVLLVVVQLALPALALPEGRKFAVKPNANKKVIAEKNEIAPVEGGFNWTSVLSTLFNMLFGASSSSIDKIDNGPNSQVGSIRPNSFLSPVLSHFLLH